jgi:hypothetical protein
VGFGIDEIAKDRSDCPTCGGVHDNGKVVSVPVPNVAGGGTVGVLKLTCVGM